MLGLFQEGSDDSVEGLHACALVGIALCQLAPNLCRAFSRIDKVLTLAVNDRLLPHPSND